MYASRQTHTFTLKDDDGQDVAIVVRKLSARELKEAAKKHTSTQLEDARNLGPELIQAFRDATKAAPDPDRFAGYDVDTVLGYGIKSWGGEKLSEEQRADLDSETTDRVYREILTLSVPTAEEAEAAQAKG